MSGQVIAGDGGRGGVSGHGGSGGWLICYGHVGETGDLPTAARESLYEQGHFQAAGGGKGGLGSHELHSPDGGGGGDGGGLLHLDHAEYPGLGN